MNLGETEPRAFITPEKLYRSHKSSLFRTFEETPHPTLGTPTRLFRDSVQGTERKSLESDQLLKREDSSGLRESVLSLNLRAVEEELRLSGVHSESLVPTIQAQPIDSDDSQLPLKPIDELRWCAFCAQEVRTMAKFVNSKKTFWSSVAILAMGGVLGCFLVPYCSESCKDVKRVCTKCSRELTL